MRCFYESGVRSGTGLCNRIRWKEVVCVGVPFGNGAVHDFGGQVDIVVEDCLFVYGISFGAEGD